MNNKLLKYICYRVCSLHQIHIPRVLCFPYNFCAGDGQERRNEDAPENNPQYTTVYVGNLAPEVSVTILVSVTFIIVDYM